MEEKVQFLSDGYKIIGNLHLPRKNAPAVVLCHGLASSKDSEKWLALTYRLYDEGSAVLRFSFRGCGLGDEWSEGASEDTTLTNRVKDYQAALDFLQASGRVDMSRVGVVGSSLGVCTALAGNDPRVKAYVFLATPPRMMPTPEMLKSFAEKGYFEYASGESPMVFRVTKALFDDFQQYDMFELIKKLRRPVLMIQGSKDEIPIKYVRELFNNASEPKRFELIEGGTHSFADDPAHLAKVIDLSAEWFKRYL